MPVFVVCTSKECAAVFGVHQSLPLPSILAASHIPTVKPMCHTLYQAVSCIDQNNVPAPKCCGPDQAESCIDQNNVPAPKCCGPDQAESCIDQNNVPAPKCCGPNVHPRIKRNPITLALFPLYQGRPIREDFTVLAEFQACLFAVLVCYLQFSRES